MNAKTLNRPTFWGTLLALTLACTATQAAPLSGAGSSFVFPVISIWGFDYSGGNSFSYEPSGSGSGIKAVEARKVLFAASDEPLTQAELVEKRLVQFPLVMGAVVPAVNLPGFATQDFKLTGPVLADLFRGKITRWNAPEIAALNPGITLPDLAVKVIHRTEGSGTTWVFTDYLTKVSPAFRRWTKSPTSLARRRSTSVALSCSPNSSQRSTGPRAPPVNTMTSSMPRNHSTCMVGVEEAGSM